MEGLKISKEHVDAIVAQAFSELPNECCGVLAGTDGTATKVYKATNIDKSPVKYTIDPKELQQIFLDAEKSKLDVLAFYHSHTFSEAYPSVTDVKLVPWPDWFDYLYVIVSLKDRSKPLMRAFKIAGKDIKEEPLQVEGALP